MCSSQIGEVFEQEELDSMQLGAERRGHSEETGVASGCVGAGASTQSPDKGGELQKGWQMQNFSCIKCAENFGVCIEENLRTLGLY